MDHATQHHQPSGWRTSKACQECRKRKIKCNGINPCKTCQLRHTPCVYRDWIRHRKKKHQEKSEKDEFEPSVAGVHASSPGFHQQSSSTGRRNPSMNYTFNNSVSATDTTSSSSEIQLYYGSTSHFALMHEIYRDLVSNPGNYSKTPQAEVEEAGAGLDMFSFRRIFFGTPVGPHDALRSLGATDVPVMFLPYELARVFLERYLATLLHLVPFRSKESYREQLEQLYNRAPGTVGDTWSHCMLLMALATGSLGTEHYSWGDILFERVKTTCALSDDLVNLQTVQLSLLMAHYQTDQGRPNSSFLHLGSAARKALSAGLHKRAPNEAEHKGHNFEERRTTFWSLYVYETWICFHLGRPRSLLQRDIGIEPPADPLLRILYDLSKMMSRSADEMFGRHHDSLLHLWKLARSITDDYRSYDTKVQETLGFGVDKCPQTGEIGVQQAILVTLYYHTILLTYRPFLIFRGRWQQDMKMSSRECDSGGTKRPTEIPTWLNDACNQVIGAACRTIHFLYEASLVNDLVKELRYHGYFLSSAAFALIFDLMHGDNLASSHLPWIHASVQCLSSMRAGDPIKSSMSAIQTVLRQLDPSYEWIPPATQATIKSNEYGYDSGTIIQHPSRNTSNRSDTTVFEQFRNDLSMGGGLPALSNMQGSLVPGNIPSTSASVGSGEDLLDLTLSDMGWDFDFSTMDLETFFSIYPNMNTPTSRET
ncbi:hypothetical protein BDV59DRAFT_89328 [Aspergillus ambiguus]|uniref:Zn(II)2Cys6 transcription factor n=1 Tax=Aspergillus ambiguus TaxID=176160 RepID=UPI003CCE0EEE